MQLSESIRQAIDGESVDFRDNHEGAWSLLKNDIHTLNQLKSEEGHQLERERNHMSESLADIAHQLKTPITSMLLMADLLEDAPPEKQVEFIHNIKSGLSRMEWLVTVLLKMARLDSGNVTFNRQRVQSNDLIEEAIKPLAILLEIKEQRLEVSGQVDYWCDKSWTVEALSNVIKNASEHSPVGGRITILCGENPLYTWLSVEDSGNGLSQEGLRSLFQRFEYSDNIKGFGIGLPLALSIMREQKGEIEVEAGGKGRGACFTMKLYK